MRGDDIAHGRWHSRHEQEKSRRLSRIIYHHDLVRGPHLVDRLDGTLHDCVEADALVDEGKVILNRLWNENDRELHLAINRGLLDLVGVPARIDVSEQVEHVHLGVEDKDWCLSAGGTRRASMFPGLEMQGSRFRVWGFMVQGLNEWSRGSRTKGPVAEGRICILFRFLRTPRSSRTVRTFSTSHSSVEYPRTEPPSL